MAWPRAMPAASSCRWRYHQLPNPISSTRMRPMAAYVILSRCSTVQSMASLAPAANWSCFRRCLVWLRTQWILTREGYAVPAGRSTEAAAADRQKVSLAATIRDRQRYTACNLFRHDSRARSADEEDLVTPAVFGDRYHIGGTGPGHSRRSSYRSRYRDGDAESGHSYPRWKDRRDRSRG